MGDKKVGAWKDNIKQIKICDVDYQCNVVSFGGGKSAEDFVQSYQFIPN